MSRSKKSSKSKARDKRKFQSKKLQKRIQQGRERSGKNWSIVNPALNIQMWKPKDGSHIIDVIPYYAGKNDPLVEKGDPTYTFEFYIHTRVGSNESSFICPAEMYNKPCPICEDRQRIREEGGDEKLWKKLFPRRRNLYNIVSYDSGEEKKGIQVWDVSYYYFEKSVMAISKKVSRNRKKENAKSEIVNFADPEEGKSISFTIEPAQSKNDYPKYVGHTFDGRDYEIDDDILDSTHVLDEVVGMSSYEEIKEAYYGNKETRSKNTPADNEDIEGLIDEVDDLDDMDELEDFIDEHDLDIKIRKKDDEDDIKEKIIKKLEQDKDDDNSDGEYTVKDIKKMSKKELKKLIEDEDLDEDMIDDAESTSELRDMIIDELDLDIPF